MSKSIINNSTNQIQGTLFPLSSLQSKKVEASFTSPDLSSNDFPIRDRKVVLHVRRRRWLAKDDTSIILKHEDLTWTGTSCSKEFADVLKKIFGHIPHTGPFSGAVL